VVPLATGVGLPLRLSDQRVDAPAHRLLASQRLLEVVAVVAAW
jgi:hypothetical protein